MERLTNSNSQRELLYHLKEEHRLRREAEIALERANRTSRRHQQMAKEYRSQIEKLNALTHDFLCQKSKMEQVAIEKNNIKTFYEDKFRAMEQVINELKKQLQHKRVSVTDQRVIVFKEKIQCLEEENDLLHDKIWRMKRKYVDKSVSTEDFDVRYDITVQSLNMLHYNNGKSGRGYFGFSNNSFNRDQYARMQNENASSIDSDSRENSDNEVTELLNEWKHKSNILAEQKQLLTDRLQQLEDERNSESESYAHSLTNNFAYTNSISPIVTPAMTINSHDDEVFLPLYTSPVFCPNGSEQRMLTEITPLESKCAGIPQQSNFNISWLARARDRSRHCSSLDSILMPLNGRTVEFLTSDDSYDPQIGLLNEQLYNLPDHKLTPAVRENLMHIRLTKYGDDVLTQSAPGRISLIEFVRDGGFVADSRGETEAIDSFNFLRDFSDVSSEQGIYTSDGSN